MMKDRKNREIGNTYFDKAKENIRIIIKVIFGTVAIILSTKYWDVIATYIYKLSLIVIGEIIIGIAVAIALYLLISIGKDIGDVGNRIIKELGEIRDGIKRLSELQQGSKSNPKNPNNTKDTEEEEEEERVKTTGGGALAGMIAGGSIGLIGGPIGVIIGGILGALIGDQIEYEQEKERREKQR